MSEPTLVEALKALSAAGARIAELEAANKICRTDIEALMSSCDNLEARNTELEAERNNYRDLNENLIDDLNRTRAGVWKLEAERDRLLIAEEDAKLFIFLHALAIEQGYMPDPGESAYDLLQRAIMTRSPRALSDPSGE